MCPQIITGTSSDLTKTVAQLVKELLESAWPVSAYDPIKTDIGFGTDWWDNYGDIDIHVNPDRAFSKPDTIGWGRSKVIDSVLIHLFVRANKEEVPVNAGGAQRKIEEIVKDNAASLGQGIPMLRWDGWERPFFDNNIKDTWHARGRASAIYWKVKV